MTSSPQVIEQAKNAKGGKLRELARKYGATGVLVYLGVGCVDLGIALVAIEFAGLDRVKQVEAGAIDVLNKAKAYIGIEESQVDSEDKEDRPSFTSVFLLAYTIHKTLFLPLRLTITAAITPAVVRKLHALGWARYAPRILGGTAVKKV
ncbi:hypothetical protein CLU79DRAFT_703310 [Phycomyces nitens]|nr:hypothetical protein CLU79DRAFT_703310 [Phycomyces nitens]